MTYNKWPSPHGHAIVSDKTDKMTQPETANVALDALIEARDELNRRNSYDVQYKTTQVLVNVHKAIKDYEESK